MKLRKLLKEIKGVFKPPSKYYYKGTNYFTPSKSKFPIWIYKRELLWKDKFETPRIEFIPYFSIRFFKWEFTVLYGTDSYWEQVLWYLKYCNKDIKKAEETWGWIDCTTNKSSWNKDYLK